MHDSITLISNTVSNLSSGSISSAQALGYRNSLHDVSARLGTDLPKLAENLLRLSDDTEVTKIKRELSEYSSLERARVDSLEMALVTKIKDDSSTRNGLRNGHKIKFQSVEHNLINENLVWILTELC